MRTHFDDLADRADNYINRISKIKTLDLKLIAVGLEDSYDVIVAEALDYLIKFDVVDLMKTELKKIARQQQNYLIDGRLRLCAALTTDENLKSLLSDDSTRLKDEYYHVWETAALSIEKHSVNYMNDLSKMRMNPDKTISSLASSLLKFVKRKIIIDQMDF